MTPELIATIRNKLQASRTALDIISQGKEVPKEFLHKALKGLDEALKLLSEVKNG